MLFKGLPIVTFRFLTLEGRLPKSGKSNNSSAKTIAVWLSSRSSLGKLITKGTIYIECHMTVAKIKKMIAQAENRKAFFKEHK